MGTVAESRRSRRYGCAYTAGPDVPYLRQKIHRFRLAELRCAPLKLCLERSVSPTLSECPFPVTLADCMIPSIIYNTFRWLSDFAHEIAAH